MIKSIKQLINKKSNVILFLISIYPTLFITGPILPDFLCTIFSIYFAYYIVKNKEYSLIKNHYFYFFFLLFIYLNINSAISFDPLISFKTSLTSIRVFLFIFFLVFILKRNPEIIKYIYIIFYIALTLLFFDSSLQAIAKMNIFFQEVGNQNRISSFFGDELIMGSYVARTLPLIIGLSNIANFQNKKKIEFANLILLLISFILIILSGERTSTFYFILFCCLYFLINSRHFIKFFFSGILIVILVSFFNPLSLKRIVNQTIYQFSQANVYLSYRHELHLLTAFEMFKDKKLFGHGLKSFRFLCSNEKYSLIIQKKINNDAIKYNKKPSTGFYDTAYKNGCNTHPHSIYLEFLAEIGLFGFSFFLIMFFFIAYRIFQYLYLIFIKKNKNNLILCRIFILTGLFISMIPMIPSGSYFNNWIMLITYYPIGFYFYTFKKLK